jgi:Cu+-exporting ATPase
LPKLFKSRRRDSGDGVNDAQALAQVEVGIDIGYGRDWRGNVGVTLIGGDLRGIVLALRLSEATMGNIWQNLFSAFVYNALTLRMPGI